MNVPVVVVDNAETDRYIARRKFSRSTGFGEILEYHSGGDFIENPPEPGNAPIVVLMDISMPGKNGFEVIDAFLARHHSKGAQENFIFMMYTSSNTEADREQAASMTAVSGYIQKPLDNQDIDHIRALVG